MKGKYRTSDFLKYINTPLNQSTISSLYDASNIDMELCNLYHDFIKSLMKLVFNTYLGDNLMDVEAQKGHFKWCWETTKVNFNGEGIDFGDEPELYAYFIEFINEVYYSTEDKGDVLTLNITNLWLYMFNPNISKSRSDIDTFIDIYQLFDKSMKKNIKT